MTKLLSLGDYAKFHITQIYTVSTADFDRAFDAFISKQVSITLNGKRISRADYEKHLQQERSNAQSSQIDFTGVVEGPTNTKVSLVALLRCIPNH